MENGIGKKGKQVKINELKSFEKQHMSQQKKKIAITGHFMATL